MDPVYFTELGTPRPIDSTEECGLIVNIIKKIIDIFNKLHTKFNERTELNNSSRNFRTIPPIDDSKPFSVYEEIHYIKQHVDNIKIGNAGNYIKTHKSEIKDSIEKAKKQILKLTQKIESMKTEIEFVYSTLFKEIGKDRETNSLTTKENKKVSHALREAQNLETVKGPLVTLRYLLQENIMFLEKTSLNIS